MPTARTNRKPLNWARNLYKLILIFRHPTPFYSLGKVLAIKYIITYIQCHFLERSDQVHPIYKKTE